MAELLSGIRVLDLTNVLAGPYCAYQLALLGADVIKVETPAGGDLARQLGASAELNKAGMGASFLAQNAGKRSVVLDLKKEADREQFLDLVATADALVENFRPGVMDRLGLGYERLKEVRPQPRLLRHLGFRPDRPDARQPGLRPDHPGPFRHHEHHGHAGNRAPARRLSRLPTRSVDWSAPSRWRRRWCARSPAAKARSSMSPCSNARCRRLAGRSRTI